VAFLIFLVFALFAGIIATVAGFGSSTLLVPIAVMLFDVKTAIALTGVFHFFGQVVDGILWRRSIVWRIGILFSILGVVFSFLGALLVVYLAPGTILRLLGIFLVVYSLFSLSGRKIHLPKKDWMVVGAGGLVGFLAGIVGTAGALRTVLLSNFNLKKNEFLGTSFAIAFFVDLTRVATYLGSGILNIPLWWWLAIVGVAILGSLIGRSLAFKIPEKSFYKLIYLALLLAGVSFVLG